MSEYQSLQLLQAGLCVLVVLVLCTYAILLREEERSPIVWFGVTVAGSAALAFGAVFLASWLNPPRGELRLEMATRLLREVPAVLIVGYGCLVQVRRYRGARNRRTVRRLFEQSPFLLSGTFLLAVLSSLLSPYPILRLLEPLPPTALFIDTVWMVPLGGFSALSAFVFFEAIGQEMPGFRQRLQNFSAGLGMCCISVIIWDAFFATGVRVLGEAGLISLNARFVTDAQVALIGTAAMSFAIAVVSFRARNRRADATERFLRFVEVVDEVTVIVENAPISGSGLSVQYASLLEAGGEELLSLSASDVRKMDDAFRVSVIWASRRRRQEVGRLLHLARVYDEDLEYNRQERLERSACIEQRDCRRELGDAPGSSEPKGLSPSEMSAVLELALSMLQKTGDPISRHGLRAAPYWAQLCGVALADGSVLDRRQRKSILEGAAVDEKVRNAYELAKWKVSTVGMNSEAVDFLDRRWRRQD